MTETVLPSFLRFREEGLIIGRILAGYGELEFEMCDCVFAINNDLDSSIRQLFGRRGELRRIKIAEELMKAQYEAAGLAAPHRAIMEDMDWCRQVRNQYAHCNWYDRENEGLCFIDLEATAKRTITNATSLIERRHRIDVPLLTEQEAFFLRPLIESGLEELQIMLSDYRKKCHNLASTIRLMAVHCQGKRATASTSAAL